MNGLMMDYQLTLPTLLRRARDVLRRQRDRHAAARQELPPLHVRRVVPPGARARGRAAGARASSAATASRRSAGTTTQHHEAYLGIPCGGFVLHTLNLRLHPNDLAYIATHAGDRAVIVDRSLMPLLELFVDRTKIEHVFVVEDSLRGAARRRRPGRLARPRARRERGGGDVLHERHDRDAEGRPLLAPLDDAAHARRRRRQPDGARHLRDTTSILPVVPMFHANAWGYPYLATMLGAKLVYPGPHLDPESLLDAFVSESVTWTAGVPTIWLGILAMLDAEPDRWDLSRMKGMLVGGSAAPRAMIAGFKQRHGLNVVHGWGMTETSPVASTAAAARRRSRDADEETQFDYIAMQGVPLPLVELRHRDDEGNVLPWDGESMGELEIRGPWVAGALLRHARAGRPLDGRRLVQDGRRRLDASARLHPDQGPLEGRDQVGRRVDLVGRARERADGASGGRRGGGDRGARREVGRAAARRGRAARRADGDGATSCARSSRRTSRSGGCRTGSSSSPRSRRRASASSGRPSCATCSRRQVPVVIETVWLDNPPVNAVNGGDHRDALVRRSSALDDDVRVVVLRGKGERAFSAGADITGFVGGWRESERPRRHPAGRRPDRAARRCRSSRPSTATASAAVSRSRSPATSGSRTATRSSASPRSNLGLLPGGGGTQRAPRLISPGRAAG